MHPCSTSFVVSASFVHANKKCDSDFSDVFFFEDVSHSLWVKVALIGEEKMDHFMTT